MRFNKSLLAIVLINAMLLIQAHADDAVSIDDFDFLTGTWAGNGMAGESEEVWMPPSAGRMFGIFKQSSEDGLIFTEFMEITEVAGEFILRLKHFNPDFTGWEEKDDYLTFRLVSVSENKATFGSLTYEVIENTNLKIHLDMKQASGITVTEIFDLRRI
jgi:hypothetical protein